MTPKPQPSREEKIARVKALEEALMLKRQKQVIAARRDINAFIEYCFSDTRKKDKQGAPLQVRQGRVHREFQESVDAYEFVFAELPRGCGKTTQCAARALFWLGRNPDELIKIISVSDPEAMKRIREVAQHIQHNHRVREVFPNLKPSDKGGWTQHAIYVQRSIVSKDASVEAYGLESSGIGGRATRIIFDDVVNPKSVRSEALRKSTRETFFGVWLPMIDVDGGDDEDQPEEDTPVPDPVDLDKAPPDFERDADGKMIRKARGGQLKGKLPPVSRSETGAKIVWIGTPWHTADLHCELKQKAPEMGWHMFSRAVGDTWAKALAKEMGAIEDEYSPVWPEMMGRKKLLIMARSIPRIFFARAYWLRPMSSEDKIWDIADFKFATWKDVANLDITGIVAACDFAFSAQAKADYNAYVCAGLGPDIEDPDSQRQAIYIFRANKWKGGLQKTAENIIRWAKRDQVDHLGLEEVQAQTWARQYIAAMALLPLRRLDPRRMGGDKIMRAIRTQPYTEQQRIYFLPGTEDLQNEMDDFPFAAHDDLVDAFVYCIILLFEYYLMNEEYDETEDDGDDDNVYDDGTMRIRSSAVQSFDSDEEGSESEGIMDKVRWK